MGVRSTGSQHPTTTEADGHLLEYFRQNFSGGGGGSIPAPSAPLQGLTASGGFVNDYTESGTVYRAHIFTANGQFQVTSIGDFGSNVEYLVVGGGGGGGNDGGGGGGAGGVKSNHPGMPSPRRGSAFPVSTSPGTYPVYVGQGGRGGYHYEGGAYPGRDGEPSRFGPTVVVLGGGGGGGNSTPGNAGGSGGGGGQGGQQPGGAAPDSNQGFAGGDANTPGNAGGAGGGGAGGVGGSSPPERPGGVGLQFLMAGPPTYTDVGAPGPGGGKQWFAGGGGGGGWPGSSTDPNEGGGPGGPYAGGGDGGTGNPAEGSHATANTGGGGGAGSGGGDRNGGDGGSGIVIVRYQIGFEKSAKATGGNVTFTSTHTIHTFSKSGTFTIPGSYPTINAQVLVVAGGGAGGTRHGGGGGAGGVLLLPQANSTIPNGATYSVVIGAGGHSGQGGNDANAGSNSSFGPPSSAAGPTHLIAVGGGKGGTYPGNGTGGNGGSGGGAQGEPGSPGGTGSQPNPSAFGNTTPYGNNGGTGGNWNPGDHRLGGGGGGAGGNGSNGGPAGPDTGDGGDGIQIQIAPNGPNFYYAGGGGGGSWAPGTPPNAGDGGLGGGGGGATSGPSTYVGTGGKIFPTYDYAGQNGTFGSENTGGSGADNTGGGGGGNGQGNYSSFPTQATGGNGGSGIVIIAYET